MNRLVYSIKRNPSAWLPRKWNICTNLLQFTIQFSSSSCSRFDRINSWCLDKYLKPFHLHICDFMSESKKINSGQVFHKNFAIKKDLWNFSRRANFSPPSYIHFRLRAVIVGNRCSREKNLILNDGFGCGRARWLRYGQGRPAVKRVGKFSFGCKSALASLMLVFTTGNLISLILFHNGTLSMVAQGLYRYAILFSSRTSSWR